MSETVQRKSYKYKLHPTSHQTQLLHETLWRCRELYNTALEQRMWAYRHCGVSVSRYGQEAELKDIRADMPGYAEIHSHVLQDVLARLDKTYQAFFKRVKAGLAPGFPRFQGLQRYHSFTYKEFGNGARLDNGFLVLFKIGRIAMRWSRPLVGTPKTITISHEADGWYVIFSCVEVPTQHLSLTGHETGIDVGLKVFLITSDGLVIDNPRHHRHAKQRLAKAQRVVSRRQLGSKRRNKAVSRCAKRHQKVKRRRADFHNKVALQLVQQYDTIYLEDLQVSNMVRNHRLAKSITDAVWAQFRITLEYKAACAGKRVVAVPPHYTSQNCSSCGERVSKSLSVRTHICPSCGLMLDRDENAARNILAVGRQWAGQALRGLAG
jgi:putative transposase